MKKIILPFRKMRVAFVGSFLLMSGMSFSQQTVWDVIVASPNHTSLEAAVLQQGLQVALQNPMANVTVFAPDDAAFDALAIELGTNLAGILALPNLTDVLTYHVLATNVPSSAITNGLIATPLSTTNTLKLTLTSTSSVFVNQALVTTADMTANNGVIHSINAVLLPVETVVDIAIDNGFTTLTTAVVTAELLPALTNPFATLTVFAPTNASFDNLATALSTNIAGLLALPNLQDVLLYHVLGATVPSSAVTNGLIASPLSPTNTLKLTLTSTSDIFVNQAQVTLPNLAASNGVVHVIDAVVLPFETVVDVAIDNGFTSLTTAVITAELLPALTNPFGTFTVFAPTNLAFTNLATALGVSLADILALPNLGNILLYHVAGQELIAANLTAGALLMLNGQNTQVSLTNGVMINSSNVTTPNLTASNGVVHVIDAVLIYNNVSINENEIEVSIYPNPVSESVTILSTGNKISNVSISNMLGQVVYTSNFSQPAMTINVQDLNPGQYIVTMTGEAGVSRQSIVVANN